MGISGHPTSSPNFFSIHTGICTCTFQCSIQSPPFESLMQRTIIVICVAGLSAETAQLLEKQLDNMTTCRASLIGWCLNMKAASTTLNLGLHCLNGFGRYAMEGVSSSQPEVVAILSSLKTGGSLTCLTKRHGKTSRLDLP